MPQVTVSIEEYNEVVELVRNLRQDLEEVKQALTDYTSDPLGWKGITACCKYFEVTPGKAIDPDTMKKMILAWIAEGELVKGVNYRTYPTGKISTKTHEPIVGYLISVEFLKGAPMPKATRTKLRVLHSDKPSKTGTL